jgi:hypothetical protein
MLEYLKTTFLFCVRPLLVKCKFEATSAPTASSLFHIEEACLQMERMTTQEEGGREGRREREEREREREREITLCQFGFLKSLNHL